MRRTQPAPEAQQARKIMMTDAQAAINRRLLSETTLDGVTGRVGRWSRRIERAGSRWTSALGPFPIRPSKVPCVLLALSRGGAAEAGVEASKLSAVGAIIDLSLQAREAFFEYQAVLQALELRRTVLDALGMSAEVAARLSGRLGSQGADDRPAPASSKGSTAARYAGPRIPIVFARSNSRTAWDRSLATGMLSASGARSDADEEARLVTVPLELSDVAGVHEPAAMHAREALSDAGFDRGKGQVEIEFAMEGVCERHASEASNAHTSSKFRNTRLFPRRATMRSGPFCKTGRRANSLVKHCSTRSSVNGSSR